MMGRRTAMLVALAGGLLIVLATALPALAAPATPLFILADTVLGPRNLRPDELAAKSCVQNSRFARNEQIVWRIRVLDPETGKAMDGTALESVRVLLPDGTVLNARYGPHPSREPTDSFWSTSWIVPAGYPTGTLRFKIVARGKDGRQGEFIQFNVAPALLTITDAVRPAVGN